MLVLGLVGNIPQTSYLQSKLFYKIYMIQTKWPLNNLPVVVKKPC